MSVAGELIEHILNPGLFLNCARTHLKDDGKLVLTTPNANCLIYFLENLLLGKEIDNPDHVAIYTATTLSLLLKKCGFVVEDIVFVAENTAVYHKNPIFKLLVYCKLMAQFALGWIQPSLCHHMLVIARKAD